MHVVVGSSSIRRHEAQQASESLTSAKSRHLTDAADQTSHLIRAAVGADTVRDLSRLAMDLMQHPDMGPMVQLKETEHLKMEARTRSSELRRAYLDSAPDALTFDRLARTIEAE